MSTNGIWVQDPAPDTDERTSEGIFVFGSAVRPPVGTAVHVQRERPGVQGGRLGSREPLADRDRLRDRHARRERHSDRADGGRPGGPDPAEPGDRQRLHRRRRHQPEVRSEAGRHRLPREPRGHAPAVQRRRRDRTVEQLRRGLDRRRQRPQRRPAQPSRRRDRGAGRLQPRALHPRRRDRRDADREHRRQALDAARRRWPTTRSTTSSTTRSSTRRRPPAPCQREVTEAPKSNELAIATFNVENLAPGDSPAKYAGLADTLINNLKAPDIVSIEEIQDNDGVTGGTASTETAANLTWNKLIAAIAAAGGPAYQYRQIDPVDDQDGGAPGGNIRQGFLFRTDRGRGVRRPAGRHVDQLDRGRQVRPRGAAADAQPGADRARRPGVHHEPQAARRRVHVEGQDRHRRRQPLQLQGRRRPAVRPPAAAGGGHGDPAARAGADRQRFRRDIRRPTCSATTWCSETSTTSSSRARSRSSRASSSWTCSTCCRRTSATRTCSRATRRRSTTSSRQPALLLPLPEYDSVHVNSEFADQQSDHDPQVARLK